MTAGQVNTHIDHFLPTLNGNVMQQKNLCYIVSSFAERYVKNCYKPSRCCILCLITAVTITGDRAPNLDLYLALTAFSSEGSFTCLTYCDMGPSCSRSYPKDPSISLLNALLLAKEQSLPILNVMGFMRPSRAGLKLMTSRMLSESTTTRLTQQTYMLL